MVRNVFNAMASVCRKTKTGGSFLWNGFLPMPCLHCSIEYTPPGFLFCPSCQQRLEVARFSQQVSPLAPNGRRQNLPADIKDDDCLGRPETKIYYSRLYHLWTKPVPYETSDVPVEMFLHCLKFENSIPAYALLRSCLRKALNNLPETQKPSLVIPVPSSRVLTAVLAKEVAGVCNARLINPLFKANGAGAKNRAQSKYQNRAGRFLSIEESVFLRQNQLPNQLLSHGPVWLVDDISTTGATLNRCSWLLVHAWGMAEKANDSKDANINDENQNRLAAFDEIARHICAFAPFYQAKHSDALLSGKGKAQTWPGPASYRDRQSKARELPLMRVKF